MMPSKLMSKNDLIPV